MQEPHTVHYQSRVNKNKVLIHISKSSRKVPNRHANHFLLESLIAGSSRGKAGQMQSLLGCLVSLRMLTTWRYIFYVGLLGFVMINCFQINTFILFSSKIFYWPCTNTNTQSYVFLRKSYNIYQLQASSCGPELLHQYQTNECRSLSLSLSLPRYF